MQIQNGTLIQAAVVQLSIGTTWLKITASVYASSVRLSY